MDNLKSVRASELTSVSAEYFDRLSLAADLAENARKLDHPPSYEASNRVKCRGEKLTTPIYWKGRQWAVTHYGVDARGQRTGFPLSSRFESREP
jgi:hypothetical protein